MVAVLTRVLLTTGHFVQKNITFAISPLLHLGPLNTNRIIYVIDSNPPLLLSVIVVVVVVAVVSSSS